MQTIPLSKYLIALTAVLTLAATPTITTGSELETSPRIVVSAEGEAQLTPDMATVTLTVNREAQTAGQALAANNAAMTEVLAAMKSEGIEDRDLQTSGFSIRPRYNHPKPKPSGERLPPEIVGYIVRNSLNVRVRDMKKLGGIVDKSVALGVNDGGQLQFSNQNPYPAIEKARIAAVKAAAAKAETLAAAAGVGTGRVLEITEHSMSPRPMPMARAELARASSADAMPVATGENTYRVSVSVTYAIEQ